jgi:hypothetical protein
MKALETLITVCRQGCGKVRACMNGQRHIERLKTIEARMENGRILRDRVAQLP